MKRILFNQEELSADSIYAMKKLTAGSSDLALKASLDLCITVLSKNGFSLDEIGKYIIHQTAEAISRYHNENFDDPGKTF